MSGAPNEPSRSSQQNGRVASRDPYADNYDVEMRQPHSSPTQEALSDDAKASFLAQLYVCMKKNFLLKKRLPFGCCLELMLPVLFVAGLVGAWAATANKNIAGEMYVDKDERLYDPMPPVRALLCNNGSVPLPGIIRCNTSHPKLYCFPPLLLPVEGLCAQDIELANRHVADLAFVFDLPRMIPQLDDMIMMRWLSRGVRGDFDPGIPGYLQSDCGLVFGSFLYFTPDNDVSRSLVSYFNSTSSLFPYVYSGIYATEQKALDFIVEKEGEGKAWALFNSVRMDDTFEIYIRMNRTTIPWTHQILDRYSSGTGTGYYRNYWTTGYLTLQRELQSFYLSKAASNPSAVVPSPAYTIMPFIAYKESEFLIIAGDLSPLVLVLAYLYSVSQLVKRLVEEKELRIREGMMIMGLHKSAFYVSWLLTYALQQLLSTIVITIILKLTMLKQADITVVFVVFLLFSFSTITFATLIASFLSKSRLAAMLSPLIYFLTAMPLFMIDPDGPSATKTNYSACAVLSPSAFALGTRLLFTYERRRGIGWKDSGSSTDQVNMGVALAFLICDMIGYFLLTLYFDAVLPSEWGTRSHPLFCFFSKKRPPRENIYEVDENGRSGFFEPERRNPGEESIDIRRLRKEFEIDGTTRVAVNDINLKLYPDEVNVLLGHNGAGKTTIINMLTGMLPITSGDAFVYGKSVVTEMSLVRRDIGMCPQHNILFDSLTVREHLEFFAGLKGMSSSERTDAATEMLREAGLGEFEDMFASNLSGGNKRKLSVAIAFIGRSRLIFLDEPTAGMDVGARRHTWDIIRRMTKGRTIVLTTHFMDEADLLGHRVTIINRGSIYCSGSPLFLKSRLGVGYTLTVATDHGISHTSIEASVRSFVTDMEVISAKGGELSLRLPMHAVAHFAPLMLHLENNGPELGIRSFSISVTTLEEVFLAISGELGVVAGNVERQTPSAASPSPHSGAHSGALAPLWSPDERGISKVDPVRQLIGLMRKRFSNIRRDRRTLCLQIFTPLLCVVLAVLMAKLGPPTPGPLEMSPNMYGERTELLNSDCGAMAAMFRSTYDLATPRTPTPSPYNFSQYMLDSFDHHSRKRYVAIKCANGSYPTVLFNNASVSYHSGAEIAATYGESFVRTQLNRSSVYLKFVQFPLPFTFREKAVIKEVMTLLVGFFILIPFTFVPSTYVSWVVKERECGAKHLQFVCGMDFKLYWISNFVFDVASFLVTESITLIIFLIFNRTEYIGRTAWFPTFVLFLCYGLSSITGSYCTNFFFKTHAQAQTIVMLVNFVSGFLLVTLAFFLQQISATKQVIKVLRFFLRAVPSYCLGEGILNLAVLPLRQRFYDNATEWTMTVIGWDVVYMAIEFPIYFVITLLFDHPQRELRRQQLFHRPDVVRRRSRTRTSTLRRSAAPWKSTTPRASTTSWLCSTCARCTTRSRATRWR